MQFIYNVVLVSAVQQSESIIHIHISILFQILFPYRSFQSIEQGSLCYIKCSHQLSVLHIEDIYVNSNLPIYSFPLVIISFFYICTLFPFCKYYVYQYQFFRFHISGDIVFVFFLTSLSMAISSSSKLLQIALFCSFLWPNTIPLCLLPHLLYPFID